MKIVNIKSRYLYIIVIVAFISLVIFSLREPEFYFPKKKGPQPDFAFENVMISQIENGHIMMEINAKYAEINKMNNEALLKKLDGTFFQKDNPTLTLSAPVATLNIDSSDMELSNATANFLLENKNIQLKASTLLWKSKPQLFIGKENIQIKTGYMKISGEYFKVNIPVRKMILAENCKAIIDHKKWKEAQ
jgi:LPS export ABC transporter protein LptC